LNKKEQRQRYRKRRSERIERGGEIIKQKNGER
jgi:hypothetical protein